MSEIHTRTRSYTHTRAHTYTNAQTGRERSTHNHIHRTAHMFRSCASSLTYKPNIYIVLLSTVRSNAIILEIDISR